MKSKTVIQRILSEMYEKIKNAYTKFKKKIRQRKKKNTETNGKEMG